MKPFLFGLILAALLATPMSSDAALFRRRARARILVRPRAAIVARAPGRRVVAPRPRIAPFRGALRRAIGGR